MHSSCANLVIKTSAMLAEVGTDAPTFVPPRVETQAAHGQGPAPVIIMNLFYTGLGIARNLAGRGLRVVGLSADPAIYGNFTRFCEVRFSPDSRERPEELAQFLLRVVGEFPGAVIFPTRDFDVLFLDRFRAELEPHYRLAIPPRPCLLRVVDKHALVEAAEEAGVPVPRTTVLRSAGELARVLADVGFPCVVKPTSSVHWRKAGNWERVGGRKAFRVDTAEELRREYENVAAVHPEILVQEWIPGPTRDIVIFGGYADEHSQPMAYFTARKIIQAPDDFGTGLVVESDDIPELVAPTLRLWRALGYQGMADVEYKRDARTGEFRLIEINTRHWDWHQLSRASGINLTWAAYCHLTGRPLTVRAPIARARWIAEDALLSHALRGLYRRELGVRELWKELSGRRMYGIFAWDDPMPWARYSLAVLLPAMSKQIWNRIRRRGRQP